MCDAMIARNLDLKRQIEDLKFRLAQKSQNLSAVARNAHMQDRRHKLIESLRATEAHRQVIMQVGAERDVWDKPDWTGTEIGEARKGTKPLYGIFVEGICSEIPTKLFPIIRETLADAYLAGVSDERDTWNTWRDV